MGIENFANKKRLALIAIAVSIILLTVGFQWYGLRWQKVQATTATIQSASPQTLFDSPYYITCEAEISGPVVDLASIQNVTEGTIYVDYVEWTTSSSYSIYTHMWIPGESSMRVYIDNTMQNIIHGDYDFITKWIEQGVENNLIKQFNTLVNNGGIDPSSTLTNIICKSSHVSGYWITFNWFAPGDNFNFRFNVSGVDFRSVRLGSDDMYSSGTWVKLYLYDVLFMELHGGGIPPTNPRYKGTVRSDLPKSEILQFRLSGDDVWSFQVWVTFFSGDNISSTISPMRQYLFLRSPGTGFALKEISPETNFPGEMMNVTLSVDIPSAEHINVTDRFPKNYTMVSFATISKYINDTLIDVYSIDVTPQTIGENKQFVINYIDAPTILGSLTTDEWLAIEYRLQTPETTGVYSFLPAEIEYKPTYRS